MTIFTLMDHNVRTAPLTPPPPLYTCHRFFHILGCLGVLKRHVSHVTCGCKKSEYLIQDGRQSGYIWSFLGILNK